MQKYLVRQNELGFEQFRQMYNQLDYGKVDSDEPAPDVQVTSSLSFNDSHEPASEVQVIL